MPLGFGIELLVDRPLEGRTVVRVKHHEDSRQTAESVEDVLAWILANIDQPVKAFDGHEGGVHVDATVFL